MTDDCAVTLAALFVQRPEPLIEPCRTIWHVGIHERVHDLMHQCSAAGGDVHDQRAVFFGVVTERALDVLMKKYAEGPFDYAAKNLESTAVIEVKITSMTGKKNG